VYGRPEGLGPVQTEYIRTEEVPRGALTATLFSLAERRLIALTHAGEKKWTVRGIGDADAWASVHPVSRAAGSARGVVASDKEFAANGTVAAGRKLDNAKNEFAGAVRKRALDEKLMVKKRSEWWARVASLVALLVVARRAVATLNRLITTIPWIFAAGAAGVSQREY
jgi:hypothetical protein